MPDFPHIRPTRQRGPDDCGVACVAMLARVEWETALAAVFPPPADEFDDGGRRQGRTRGLKTTARRVAEGLRRLEVACAERLVPTRGGGWASLPTLAVVKVRPPGLLKSRGWHWVVFERAPGSSGVICDPISGEEILARGYPLPPLAYLAVSDMRWTPKDRSPSEPVGAADAIVPSPL